MPLLLFAALAVAQATAAGPAVVVLPRLSGTVREEELRATVERLVGFGTRHTLSDTASPTRGIGAARNWTAARFSAISKDCGGCLEVVRPAETFTGARMPPQGAVVQDVLAIQRGTTDPGRVVVISGHIDSRVTDVMNATSDAPGANDDGSGVAAVIEAARVLSQETFPATIVYAVLSGEEQGLYGGKVLANYARAQGWRVEAALNNDIIGNTTGQDGRHEDGYVRVFSEGTKAVETPADIARRRPTGGELDSPSRNLARFIDSLGGKNLSECARCAGLRLAPLAGVKMVYRLDRYGRGGDQTPMVEAGFPAVRFTEAVENWDRQHQDLRPGFGDTVAGVDFPYLAKVTRLNVAALAALARAPAPPEELKAEGALSDDTTLSWKLSPGAVRYEACWRDSIEPRWTCGQDAGAATTVMVKDRVIDDWLFGVRAISADGFASPVEFPGAAGSFVSPPPPPKP